MTVKGNLSLERRFVVLFHDGGVRSDGCMEPHFDWMFEWDGQLRTWATPVISFESRDEPIAVSCQPLPNHRIDYLDYEGEISGGRGTVRRQLSGWYWVTEESDDCFGAMLRWKLNGRWRSARLVIDRDAFSDGEGQLDERREFWRLRLSPPRWDVSQ